jgi:hypothetical protein
MDMLILFRRARAITTQSVAALAELTVTTAVLIGAAPLLDPEQIKLLK